jgi:transposase
MSIVGSFDVHRRQITFDYLDTDTGRVVRGRITPAYRAVLRQWLAQRFAGRTDVAFAVEACTGWRFVVEELEQAGIEASLAETADTAAARGRKRRAKTDGTDTTLMRELLAAGRLPTSWIPPVQVREMRAILELYKDLRDEHTAWVQRVHATLFHHGVPQLGVDVTSPVGRARLQAGEGLSPAGGQAVTVALRMMDALQTELDALYRHIGSFARRQPGCKALQAQYGVGPITATAIWAMMGDTRRFGASRQAVRHTGLDVTVYSSDGKRPPGTWPSRDRRCCAGRCTRLPAWPATPAPPTTTSTPPSRTVSTTNGPPSPLPVRSPAVRITSCVSSATKPTRRPDTARGNGCEWLRPPTPMRRGRLPARVLSPPHGRGRP